MNSLKTAFKISNKYIILATPLILFTLFSSLYLVFSANGKLINLIIAMILYILMTATFIAGWFKMITVAVLQPELEEANSIIKDFPSGVGEYFLSSIGFLFNMFIVMIVILITSGRLGMKFIGNPHISQQDFYAAMESATALKTFVSSLSTEQLIQLNQWNFLLLIALSAIGFILIFHLPAIFFKTKNPFKAFWFSIKDLFNKKILQTFAIYLVLLFIYFILSVLLTITMGNFILHFIVTLMNFYYITVACVWVFYFYYHNFVEGYLGQNVDTKV